MADYLVKRTIDDFKSDCSLTKFSYGSNYQPSCVHGLYNSSFIESIKIKDFKNLARNNIIYQAVENSYVEIPEEGEQKEDDYLIKMAQNDIASLNIESRFRSFMVAKRVK